MGFEVEESSICILTPRSERHGPMHSFCFIFRMQGACEATPETASTGPKRGFTLALMHLPRSLGGQTSPISSLTTNHVSTAMFIETFGINLGRLDDNSIAIVGCYSFYGSNPTASGPRFHPGPCR